MKNKLLKVILPFIIPSQVFGYCYYVPCDPSVSVATTITTTNLEQSFLQINYEINEIGNAYSEYLSAIETNNKAYEKNKKIKYAYLLKIKEMNSLQKQLLKMKSKKRENNEN